MSVQQEKRQNDDYRMSVKEACPGNIEIDYEIRGNEYEAEQFWMKLQGLLDAHENEFGGDE